MMNETTTTNDNGSNPGGATMTITDVNSAHEFLHAWNGRERAGILGAAIDGLRTVASLERQAGNREAELDALEAVGVIKLRYFKVFGRCYL